MRISRSRLLAAIVATTTMVAAVACSPGTLPGSPSPIRAAGGGGRYNGTIVTRRVAGPYTINEGAQAFNLSVVLRPDAQLTGQFNAGETAGSMQGVLDGTLNGGTYHATVLVQTVARQGTATSSCEGRGDITIILSGASLSWSNGAIDYPNCPGLSVSSQAQATATTPIPAASGGLANVVVTILGGAAIARSTCGGAVSGFPFTVEMQETAGVEVTFDSTFTIEERRNFGAITRTTLDMPFTNLTGGSRRTYSACSPTPGAYQAFFSGRDANGNRVHTASPVVTMGP
jgi:hypothetical protein